MTALPIPCYELAIANRPEDIPTRLDEWGWTSLASRSEGVVTMFAFRQAGLPDIKDPVALVERLALPEESVGSGEHLEVRAAEAPLEDRTRVFYRGVNADYFRHIVNGLVEYGQRAELEAPQVPRVPRKDEVSLLDTVKNGLRAHVGLEVAGGLVVAGTALALTRHRH